MQANRGFYRAHLAVKSRKPPCRQASGTTDWSLRLREILRLQYPCRDQVAPNISAPRFRANAPSCWALPNYVPHQERSLLHRFRRRAYPYVGRAVTAGEAIFSGEASRFASERRPPSRLSACSRECASRSPAIKRHGSRYLAGCGFRPFGAPLGILEHPPSSITRPDAAWGDAQPFRRATTIGRE